LVEPELEPEDLPPVAGVDDLPALGVARPEVALVPGVVRPGVDGLLPGAV